MINLVILVPDRPTPAEQWTVIGWLLSGGTCSLKVRTKRVNNDGGFGTPKSKTKIIIKKLVIIVQSNLGLKINRFH